MTIEPMVRPIIRFDSRITILSFQERGICMFQHLSINQSMSQSSRLIKTRKVALHVIITVHLFMAPDWQILEGTVMLNSSSEPKGKAPLLGGVFNT